MEESEVQRKLTRMVRFIELEGDEKAQEINDRTEEEFHINKGNLIQVGRIKINQEYDKRLALLNNQTQVELGIIKAKFRNDMLESKRKMIVDLHNQIYKRITLDLNCVNRRWNVLQLLIMESLFTLLENNVTIKCREADAVIISKHLDDLQAKFELYTKLKINLTLSSIYLGDETLPGIILYTNNGKIHVINTMDKRLDQVIKYVTPVLSSIFYGTKTFRTHIS